MSSCNTLAQSGHAQAAASNLAYDLALLFFRGIINVFFREVRPRGAFNIPLDGPVIFVGAPHSNQVGFPVLNRMRSPIHPTESCSSSIFCLHCRSIASQGDAPLSWWLRRVCTGEL